MKFERFTWDLYKESERGKSAIEELATARAVIRASDGVNVLVLCDKLYIYAYDGKQGFGRSNYTRYSWNELQENPDKFNQLKNIFK